MEQLKKVAVEVQFLGYDKDYCMIFGIYGPKIDKSNKNLMIFTIKRIIDESFYMETKQRGEAKGFKKYSTEGISLVFFNNCLTKKKSKSVVSSKDILEPMKIEDFKQDVIREMEIKHLVRINEIYLVYPSILKNGFYDSFYTYAESLYDLVLQLGPLFEAHRIDPSVIAYDKTITSKNWRIVFSESQKAHSFNELTNYEKMCQLSSSDNLQNVTQYKYKKRLKEYKIEPEKEIPLVLRLLMEHISSNFLRFEGIFRKVAEEKELIRFENFLLGLQQQYCLNNLSKEMFMTEFAQKISNFEVETLTSFFKKVFIQLQQPIFSNDVYQKIVSLTLPEIENLSYLLEAEKSKSQKINMKKSQKTESNIEVPQNLTSSYSVSQQFEVPCKVSERVALFESMSFSVFTNGQNIGRSLAPQEKLKDQKVTFKKIPNGKKKGSEAQRPLQTSIIKPFQEKNCFLQLMKKENPLEYTVLKWVVLFLNEVSKESRYNLMSGNNLAVCFNPCFFRTINRFDVSTLLSIEEECLRNLKLVKVLEKLINENAN